MNDHSKKVTDLPPDWWQQIYTAEILAKEFQRRLLALFVVFREYPERQLKPELYTGFLLDYRDSLLWITAGHCVDEIRHLLANPNVQIKKVGWVDGLDVPGAETVILHNRNLNMVSATDRGIDVGLVEIAGLDRDNILAGGQVEPMTEQGWFQNDSAQPEGYYLVGYPTESRAIQRQPISEELLKMSMTASCLCIPMERISHSDSEEPRSFWSDPVAFYGQLLPFADTPSDQPQSIKGMSGGPILSIERDKTQNGFRYRLFGIQSCWLKQSRRIRAEPIEKVVALMND